jgi:FkbM family methyltransferase
VSGLIGTLGFVTNHPLTREAKIAAVGRFVSWQIRSRLQRENVVDWVHPTKLVVRRGLAGATGNIYCGLHEFPDMGFVVHFLRPEDLFVDVGANIGSYTVLASGVCRARTFAVEPDPDTLERLAMNIAVNGLGAKVRTFRTALGDHEGEVAFTVGLDSINKVIAPGSANARTVPLTMLDRLLTLAEPAMIKMDVEGYEESVIKGANATLAKASLKAVQTELITPEIERQLGSVGFTRMYYDPFTRRLADTPVGHHSNNALFIRDREFVAARLETARAIRVLGREL